jgi:hypothetical protein
MGISKRRKRVFENRPARLLSLMYNVRLAGIKAAAK